MRRWHGEHPLDYRATRRLVRDKYSLHGGAMRDRNGYELNTAATVAALLYGEGDFARTLLVAFNFGWDADNTAATAGTIIGVTKGYRWMMAQGWKIVDRYRNTTREEMPEDETITSFADRLIDLAEEVILTHGGERLRTGGELRYRIRAEEPRCVLELPSLPEQTAEMRRTLEAEIDAALTRLMYTRFRLGMFDPAEQVPFAQIPYSVNQAPEHDQLARRAAQASMVLLKNDGVLPLA